MSLDITAAHGFARELVATYGESVALREVVTGVEQRLHFLLETGLGYLTLDRDYGTLSWGEAQRGRAGGNLARDGRRGEHACSGEGLEHQALSLRPVS